MATIQGAAATTSFIDAQHSASGGVLLQVCGSMKKQVCAAREIASGIASNSISLFPAGPRLQVHAVVLPGGSLAMSL